MKRAFVSFAATATRDALVVTIALLSSSVAPAQPDYARNGAYLGLGGTFAAYTEVEDEIEKSLASLGYLIPIEVDNPLGLNTRVGYRAHPHFSAELEFEWLSQADVSVPGFGALVGIDSWTLMANAKGYLLTERWQPYALLGLGLMETELSGLGISQTAQGFAARFGGGLDYYITPNVVGNLGVTYVLPTGDLDGLDYVSFVWGLGYRF